MEEKLDNGEYNSFTEFRTDFKLIVNNCRLYNGQSNGKVAVEIVSKASLTDSVLHNFRIH